MRYRIISVGKIKDTYYLNGIKEYLKRLQPYAGIELVDGLEEKTKPRAGQSEIERVLSREGARVLKLVGDDDLMVILDIQGNSISSETFAQLLAQWNISGKSRVNLVIGGSHGLSEEVKNRANYRLSFSPMTFPYQMALLMLTEQLYRGFKILKGEPYHK